MEVRGGVRVGQAFRAGTGGRPAPAPVTRRRLLGALPAGALAAGALALTACEVGRSGSGGGAAQGELPAPTASKPAGTVELWQGWQTRGPLLRTFLDQFERETPGVKVVDTEMLTFGGGTGGREKALASVVAGTAPDCLMLFREMYADLAKVGALVNLQGYVRRDRFDLKVFSETEIAERTFRGALVGLPAISAAAAGLTLFWNKDHFRQAGLDPERGPQTWEQLEDYAQRLTLRQGTAIDRLGVHPLGRFPVWLYTNNGRLYSDDGKKVAFQTREGLDTLAWVLQLLKRQGADGEALTTFGAGDQGGDARQSFFRGRRSMILEVDNFPGVARLDPVGKDLDWGIGLLPHNGRNPQAKLQIPSDGGLGYGVTNGAKNPEAAWALTKFLTASDAQCAFMTREQGRISALKRCNTDPEVQRRPEFKVFAQQVERSVAVPFAPGHQLAQTAIGRHVAAAVAGTVGPDAALKLAADEAQAILDDTWRTWGG